MQIIANGERRNWMLSLVVSAWHVLYQQFSHQVTFVFVSTPSVLNYKKKKKSHLLRKLKHKNLEYSFLCFLWKKFIGRCKNNFHWLLFMEKMKERENWM